VKRRRTEVVLEFEEVVVKRASRARDLAWCEVCRKHVQMMTPDDAAIVAGVSARTVFQWIEASKIHFIELSRDQLLVCGSTLPTQETEAGGHPS